MGHFQHQNIIGENAIRTVRQGGEVYGAPRLRRLVPPPRITFPPEIFPYWKMPCRDAKEYI